MHNLFNTMALIMLIIWVIGFFILNVGIVIHAFFFLAGICLLLRILQEDRIIK